MIDKIKLGKLGEKIAAKYLENNGYSLLTKNYHTPEGEIDIICQKEKVIFFVEVKIRKNLDFGWPEEAIDDRKMEKIALACQRYLQENKIRTDWQIDAICLIFDQDKRKIRLKHLKRLDID